ncbi:MAG: hypothetical protein M3Y57_05335 [Acidobacteriota bacterium]|nr:hypothetical protein [Acidobacteriota bacterium]
MPNNALRKQGTVQAFNVSPKGAYEGLLLQTKDELIQVNFPQEFAAAMSDLAASAADVQLEVEAQKVDGHACHPVYRLLNVMNGKEFAGKVTRLNYALHGEVNGAILDSGDFLHVKPQGAAALKLKVGMKVKGTGSTKPMVGGHRVIEADEVNGVRIEKKPKPKKKAH